MNKELKLGLTYLIRKKYFYNGELYQLKVTNISKLAYQFTTLNGHIYWESKESFHSDNLIFDLVDE